MQCAACTEIKYVSPDDVDKEMIESERGVMLQMPDMEVRGCEHSFSSFISSSSAASSSFSASSSSFSASFASSSFYSFSSFTSSFSSSSPSCSSSSSSPPPPPPPPSPPQPPPPPPPPLPRPRPPPPSPPPPPSFFSSVTRRACRSIHADCKPCFDLGRMRVLNDPAAWVSLRRSSKRSCRVGWTRW